MTKISRYYRCFSCHRYHIDISKNRYLKCLYRYDTDKSISANSDISRYFQCVDPSLFRRHRFGNGSLVSFMFHDVQWRPPIERVQSRKWPTSYLGKIDSCIDSLSVTSLIGLLQSTAIMKNYWKRQDVSGAQTYIYFLHYLTCIRVLPESANRDDILLQSRT